MKIAFFLGAGASVCAGMPTTKTLMTGMLTKHQNCVFGPILRQYAGSDIEDLYGDIKSLLDLKSNKVLAELPIACAGSPVLDVVQDVEEDGPFFERDCKEHAKLGVYEDHPELFEPTFEQLEALQLAARNYMFDTIRTNPKRFAEYKKTFAQLHKFAGDEPVTVITTNYDMLVEEYCSDNDIKIADYFKRGPHSLRGTWLGQIHTDDYRVKLVKLHGSLNWHKNDDGEILCENAIVQHDFTRDVLVAPTPDKQDKASTPFSILLGRFNEILTDLDLLVVIGFSFRDKELSDKIKTKADDAGMRVICISKELDPWTTSRCQRLRVENGSVKAMKKLERESKHPNMYAFESEFGSMQMDDIMIVLEHVRSCTPAYARERA